MMGKSHEKVTKVGRWDSKEHKLFIFAINRLGKNWKAISKIVGSRTPNQVRSHAQKFEKRPVFGLKSLKTQDSPKVDAATQYGEGILFLDFSRWMEILNKIFE